MRAVIVADGCGSLGEVSWQAVRGADLVVAADGGAESLTSAGFWPNAVIGDFDSLSPETLDVLRDRGCEIIAHPRRKDKTDSELALGWCVERGARDIAIVGATGGERLDHALANVFLLTAPVLDGIRVRIIDERNEVFLLRGVGTIEGEMGDTVSLIPVTPEVKGISTQGLEYPLRGGSIRMGSTLGISNVLVSERARVSVSEGSLLVIVHHRRREASR